MMSAWRERAKALRSLIRFSSKPPPRVAISVRGEKWAGYLLAPQGLVDEMRIAGLVGVRGGRPYLQAVAPRQHVKLLIISADGRRSVRLEVPLPEFAEMTRMGIIGDRGSGYFLKTDQTSVPRMVGDGITGI